MADLLDTYKAKCTDFACDPIQPVVDMLSTGQPVTALKLRGSQKALFSKRVTDMQVLALCETFYEHCTLRIVDVSFNQLNDRAAKALARLIQITPAIKLLDLTGNDVGPEGAAALAEAAAKQVAGLRGGGALLLRGNPIGDAGAAKLAEMLMGAPDAALSVLDLAECHLGLRGVIAVVAAMIEPQPNKALTSLDLEAVCVQNPAEAEMMVQHLIRLMLAHTSLKELSLAKMGLTDHFLETLTVYGFLRQPSLGLTRLSLRANRLSPFSGATLERLLSEGPKLSSLDLAHNQLGNDGATALARCLPMCPALKELDLRGNNIGDAGLVALAEALPMTDIKRLQLWGNAFGPGACKALSEALAALPPPRLVTDLKPYVVDGEPKLALLDMNEL